MADFSAVLGKLCPADFFFPKEGTAISREIVTPFYPILHSNILLDVTAPQV